MLMDGRTIESERHRWFKFGGKETLESYAGDEDDIAGLEDIPLSHWEFLFEKLVTIHETETHFVVHASVEPTVPLHDQGDYLPYWGGYSQAFPRHISGKIMVCGHKIQSTGDLWQANQCGETRRMNLSNE